MVGYYVVKGDYEEKLIDFSGWRRQLNGEFNLDFTPPLKKLCEVRKFNRDEGVTYLLLPGRKYAAKVPVVGLPNYACLSTCTFTPEYLECGHEDFSDSCKGGLAVDDSLLKKTFVNGLTVSSGEIYESCEARKRKGIRLCSARGNWR